jgi:hypothetical protein
MNGGDIKMKNNTKAILLFIVGLVLLGWSVFYPSSIYINKLIERLGEALIFAAVIVFIFGGKKGKDVFKKN